MVVATVLISTAASGQRHERKAEELADSEKIQNVTGGTTFINAASIDKTYDDLLTYVKREGYGIDSASKETGQIVTAIQVTGGYHQTGTRIYLTVIKDSDVQTTVRVAVSEQKRYKAVQTEPWGTPKVNEKKSADLADKVKAAIKT